METHNPLNSDEILSPSKLQDKQDLKCFNKTDTFSFFEEEIIGSVQFNGVVSCIDLEMSN